MQDAISLSEITALTLRFLATGVTFCSLQFQFQTARDAVSYIVIEVCKASFKKMSPEHLAFRTPQLSGRKSKRFFLDDGTFLIAVEL